MNTFEAQILTPNGSLFDDEVVGVQVPGAQGGFEVKVNHASIVSALDIGRVRVRRSDNSEELFAVSGGFVEVNDNKLTLLAESAESRSDIDVQRAQEARDRALDHLNEKDVDKERARKALQRANNRLSIAEG
ncbi:MAG: ATP synthase F1 subunit epsilon [Bacteroidota bacterium]